jgi:glutathione S-transferase
MAAKLIIANKAYSSWSLRGWLVTKASGIPFEEVLIPLREAGSSAEILKHSPSGKVPCLIDGKITVWDSLAILEYLHEQRPQAGLYPADRGERARHRSLCAEIHSGFFNLRNICGMNLRRKGIPPKTPGDLGPEIARLEQIVADLPIPKTMDGLGAFMTPLATRFRSYGLPMSPGLTAHFGALLNHPFFLEWEKAALAETWVIPDYEAL